MSRGVDLAIARALLEAAAEEMGAVLQRAAFSPNIKERRDHSCALFDREGRLLAQAQHMPVHLGAMQASVDAALRTFPDLGAGDVVALNDPYDGGTHLPDVTMVQPVLHAGERVGYAASRAHHGDVGGMVAGSMPAGATELYQEGLVLPPVRLVEAGEMRDDLLRVLLANVRTPAERRGDLRAQLAANRVGTRRLEELSARHGDGFAALQDALLDASEALADTALRALPAGEAEAEDALEGDGVTEADLPIRVRVRLTDGRLQADFTGTAPQAPGNLNAPPPVTHACVQYVARTLVGKDVMANAGLARRLAVTLPPGSLLNPRPPAAVAAGNVETSQRIVDVLYAALAKLAPDHVPAASQGTMNNLTLGGSGPQGPWTYYETIAGGQGAHPRAAGMSGVHTHMTNTLNTPVEALERAYPLRVRAYRLRPGTGGEGARPGGAGVVRALEVLTDAPVEASLLTDRRRRAPPGLAGGGDGAPGRNRVVRPDGTEEALPAKARVRLERGCVLVVETPGGGGWGAP